MKTPGEIKKGLEIETSVHFHFPDPEPRLTPKEFLYLEQLHKDALYYICQLECRLAKAYTANERALKYLEKLRNQLTEANQQKSCLEYRLAQAERERDAAVADITGMLETSDCEVRHVYCSRSTPPFECNADECKGYAKWRGVCEENSKEGSKRDLKT